MSPTEFLDPRKCRPKTIVVTSDGAKTTAQCYHKSLGSQEIQPLLSPFESPSEASPSKTPPHRQSSPQIILQQTLSYKYRNSRRSTGQFSVPGREYSNLSSFSSVYYNNFRRYSAESFRRSGYYSPINLSNRTLYCAKCYRSLLIDIESNIF
ncbi:unnamed protein product [Enterobius vermicularis]|uniref:Uncharacterized protein n=1 Tax=Enterobius vermicularis TaxID=51028 RepID=A0A0N4VPR0_ENTVE|nr:unnamed protein product [Enterobius vermicularis]